MRGVNRVLLVQHHFHGIKQATAVALAQTAVTVSKGINREIIANQSTYIVYL